MPQSGHLKHAANTHGIYVCWEYVELQLQQYVLEFFSTTVFLIKIYYKFPEAKDTNLTMLMAKGREEPPTNVARGATLTVHHLVIDTQTINNQTPPSSWKQTKIRSYHCDRSTFHLQFLQKSIRLDMRTAGMRPAVEVPGEMERGKEGGEEGWRVRRNKNITWSMTYITSLIF